MVQGQLQTLHIYVPRRTVRERLNRVCSMAVENWSSSTIIRWVYKVPCSNTLWHIDGLHSLIRWRIVIHGCIDGYSRNIMYLHASDNNRATTVLNPFLEATRENSWPSRVQSYKGGENIDVARAMLTVWGTNRSSHITGSSVHNRHTECLWHDTFRCVCHSFYSLFYEMEEIQLLCPTDELQLYSLHCTFSPILNIQLRDFQSSWNNHHLRSEHGFTPNQLWLQGLQDCVDDNFGAEDGRANPFDMGRVEIPRISINISTAQEHLLRAQINPLTYSDCNGLDHYINVYYFLKNILWLFCWYM